MDVMHVNYFQDGTTVIRDKTRTKAEQSVYTPYISQTLKFCKLLSCLRLFSQIQPLNLANTDAGSLQEEKIQMVFT